MSMPLYKQLYMYILGEIKNGRLKSGDRIPSEKELSEQFNVSRITSKKAFDMLAQAKVIERSRGKGSFVSKTVPDLTVLEGALDEEQPLGKSDDAQMVGLILPHFTDVFGTRLVQTIEEQISKMNMHLVLKRTQGRQDEEERAIRSLVQLGVEGLIVFPVHGEHYNAELLRLVLDDFPVVLVDRYLKGIPAHAVYTDNSKAAEQITDYLFDRGHEHIAMISPPVEHTSTLEERVQGFIHAHNKRNLRVNPDYLLTGLLSTLPSYAKEEKLGADEEMLMRLIMRHPELTAFVACEFKVAFLLSVVLEKLGKLPGGRYSIVCFDSMNEPLGTPYFTHIRQDEQAMGIAAVDVLLKQINGESGSDSKHHVIDFRLVESRVPAAFPGR
jgi:GntR family transcriptional regulator of arabinose operon